MSYPQWVICFAYRHFVQNVKRNAVSPRHLRFTLYVLRLPEMAMIISNDPLGFLLNLDAPGVDALGGEGEWPQLHAGLAEHALQLEPPVERAGEDHKPSAARAGDFAAPCAM